MTTTALSAIAIYADAHPHHVARIQERVNASLPGAVVTIDVDRTTDTGSFFTGIHDGDRVVITSRHDYKGHTSLCVQEIEHASAHLSVNDGHTLTPVDPAEWTVADATAAHRAAVKYTEDAQAEALTHATGYGRYDTVQPDGEARAIEALHAAAEAKRYAFAVSHYIRVLAAVEQASRDSKYAAVLADRGMHAVA